MRRSVRDDAGTALVELPITFVALCVFFLCLTALGQVFVEYHDLSGASRAAARYATKSDYDPSASPETSSRRPSTDAVVAFAQKAAAPIPAAEVNVAVTPDDVAGDGVMIDVHHTIHGGPYGLLVDSVDRLLSVIGAGPLPDVTIRSTSTALYE